MAQPTAIEYLGAITAPARTAILSADILTTYPLATVMQMKTHDVKVSVNGTDMFDVTYDDTSYITSGHSYVFSKECTIAIGIYKAV